MPESHKHQQERSITNRSGQQYPGEIAAGGHATPEGLPGAKNTRRAGRLTESPRENPKDTVAMVIEANRELTPPSCPPHICPRSSPGTPDLLPADAPEFIAGGVDGTSGDCHGGRGGRVGPRGSRVFMGRIGWLAFEFFWGSDNRDVRNLLDW